MRKLFAILTLFSAISFASVPVAFAQDSAATTTEESAETTVQETTAPSTTDSAPTEVREVGFRNTMKQLFIEGGYLYMAPVLFCFIIGLAVSIERIIYLNMAAINSEKFLVKIENAMKSGGVEEAKNVCRSVPGPIAGIIMEGLNRVEEGKESVENTITAYGSVETGKMESGLPWLALFIALAPMLGFLGTVIGMIEAFQDIEAAGDISPNIVAGGIKVALITTVGGLIVAIFLQIFYNYIASKIDGLVNEMEEVSVKFMDILVRLGK